MSSSPPPRDLANVTLVAGSAPPLPDPDPDPAPASQCLSCASTPEEDICICVDSPEEATDVMAQVKEVEGEEEDAL